MEDSGEILVPFLKWAGGKRWFALGYNSLFPSRYQRYFEPFLGSGAVFFSLKPDRAILSDCNEELVNAYIQIRENWQKVNRSLRRHQRNHSARYYYLERQRHHRVAYERAAQFIYLNRTCWNGLYRVNLKGKFNVPIGTKSSVLLDTDDFAQTANHRWILTGSPRHSRRCGFSSPSGTYTTLAMPGELVSAEAFKRLFDKVNVESAYFTVERFQPGTAGEAALRRFLAQHIFGE